ncbi:unnamed protein product [Vitrella brassicaformis CCMP3155]|uniref:Uncharacterized protein n=1 Tax=Vitrella brassicaformis (strain CCMP3155) TaxID=1169540 RepID=A0A0G4GGA7_VITBC|nr:unnamed protein product [Vitrella brassicaformis CCMP3155]|eukprot:CEM28650.1 unnamed protein product [Vitrella brassicaformis CCMP3155]
MATVEVDLRSSPRSHPKGSSRVDHRRAQAASSPLRRRVHYVPPPPRPPLPKPTRVSEGRHGDRQHQQHLLAPPPPTAHLPLRMTPAPPRQMPHQRARHNVHMVPAPPRPPLPTPPTAHHPRTTGTHTRMAIGRSRPPRRRGGSSAVAEGRDLPPPQRGGQGGQGGRGGLRSVEGPRDNHPRRERGERPQAPDDGRDRDEVMVPAAAAPEGHPDSDPWRLGGQDERPASLCRSPMNIQSPQTRFGKT